MSVLPNELLVSILSLLSFKETTATSILSRRWNWRYLHTFTPKLDFDGTKLLRKVKKCGYKDFAEERRNYVKWVDCVVRLHQSSRLEEFRVFFNLTTSHTQHIDEWIRFSLSRKVETLELYFTDDGDDDRTRDSYTLTLPPPSDKYNSNFIEKLSTFHVDVSGEAVEMFLRNCPLLEQLIVAHSEHLLAPEIIKPFPSFKCLELLWCPNLASVVVSDSNVVRVKIVNVVLVNVPLLTELWIAGKPTGCVEDFVAMFSSVLPQLHMLKICFIYKRLALDKLKKFCSKLCSAVEMSNLMQLMVDIGELCHDGDSLLPSTDLIRASPRLQRFVMEAPHDKNHVDESRKIPRVRSANRKIPKDYPHLKEIEFVGYRGLSSEFDMVMHLVKNAIALEKIVVDPWGFKLRWDVSWDKIPRRKFNEQVFARANELKECVPFGINVKIL